MESVHVCDYYHVIMYVFIHACVYYYTVIHVLVKAWLRVLYRIYTYELPVELLFLATRPEASMYKSDRARRSHALTNTYIIIYTYDVCGLHNLHTKVI